MSYVVQNLTFDSLENKINLPTYQRPVVWTNSEKQSFINSLHRGFPFGSLLLYQFPKDLEKFTLIDGQQRLTTMRDYVKHPDKYFPIDEFSFLDECIELCKIENQSLAGKSDLSSKFNKEIENCVKELSKNKDLDVFYLSDRISEIWPPAKEDEDASRGLTRLQSKIASEFENYLDLDAIMIPCVIYEGEESNLPDVFASVNLGGRKLTKYQVFAAQWNYYKVHLTTGEIPSQILEDVILRYEELTESRDGIEIKDFNADEMRGNRTVTLPEFCHALGQQIVRRCPACLPEKTLSLDDAVDTIGYNTLAIIFGIKPQEINTLGKKYADSGLEDNPEKIEKLLNTALKEYAAINNEFAHYLRKPGKKFEGATSDCFENRQAIGQLQFLSFFAALWRVRYGIKTEDFEPQVGSKEPYQRTRKQIFVNYLIDMLNSNWKGSGDNRLAGYIEGNKTYLSSATSASLSNAFDRWFEQERNTPSVNVDYVTKILLTVYASLKSKDYNAQSYDFEHIISKKTLNRRIGDGEPIYRQLGIPGGRLGNIMLLDSSHNRSKQEKNLGASAYEEFSIKKERNYLPNANELNHIEDCILDGNNAAFMSMFDNRCDGIFRDIKSHFFPDD